MTCSSFIIKLQDIMIHAHPPSHFPFTIKIASPFNFLITSSSKNNMPNLQQGLTGNHLHPFNPDCQTTNSHDSTRSAEFDFWEAQEIKNYKTVGDFGCSEVEFQVQTQNGDRFNACSPPLWKADRGINNEVHPLLPRSHHYRNISPRSRMQAIAKGRRELMEMYQNMPESSYELSLRDIVDQDILQKAGQEIAAEDIGLDIKTGVQIQQQKKKKKTIQPCQLSRSGSMDNTTFLLKMFFPTSLTVKNSTTGKRTKVTSRSSSFEGSEHRANNKWWKKTFSIAGESAGNGRSSTGSNNNSNSSRHADSNFLPGCWPFYHTKKSKTWRPRGCIF